MRLTSALLASAWLLLSAVGSADGIARTVSLPMRPLAEPEPVLDVDDEPFVLLRWRAYASARVDVVVDDSRMQDIELPMWVEPEASAPTRGGNRDDAELSSHPWLTRVGVAVERWRIDQDVLVDGRVELDFLQEGDSNRPQPRFRHAFGRVSVRDWGFLIGHTDDLVAPLRPSVNDASQMWNAGNLGDRRAQFRASYAPRIGRGRLRLATAVGMPNTVDERDLDQDGQLDGLDAAFPMGQGLVELIGPYWTRSRPFRVGVSGHVAIADVDDVDDDNPPAGAFDYDGAQRLHAFSLVGHLQIPIFDNMWIKGEGFYGQNLSDVRGNIGQSISLTTGQEIRGFGGWGEFGLQARWWQGSLGGSIDQPLKGDVADGQRSRNATFFASSRFKPVAPLTLAIEYSYWATSYQNQGLGTAQRFNLWSSVDF